MVLYVFASVDVRTDQYGFSLSTIISHRTEDRELGTKHTAGFILGDDIPARIRYIEMTGYGLSISLVGHITTLQDRTGCL